MEEGEEEEMRVEESERESYRHVEKGGQGPGAKSQASRRQAQKGASKEDCGQEEASQEA